MRNELCSNNLYDFGLNKGLDHLDEVCHGFQTIISRFVGFQTQWLNVHTDFPLLQRIALPVTVGSVRYPASKSTTPVSFASLRSCCTPALMSAVGRHAKSTRPSRSRSVVKTF